MDPSVKLSVGLKLLRGEAGNPPLPRERELIRLCNELAHGKIPEAFPGMQPTSLTRQKISEYLIQEPYVVCEKTDGERHLLLAHQARVFLLDRRCQVWLCPLQLPLPQEHTAAPGWHHNTLLDGELVVDTLRPPSSSGSSGGGDSEAATAGAGMGAGAGTGTGASGDPVRRLRYLVYDAISICGADLTHQPLLRRLQRALEDVVLPKERLNAVEPPAEPVHILVKDFFELWHIRHVVNLSEHLPHKNDGLVFTPVRVPYSPGTCPALLKWKPASQNTVDFMLKMVVGGGKSLHVKLLVGLKKAEEWQVKFCGHWLAKTGSMFKTLQQDPRAFDGKIGECRWQTTAKTFTPANPDVFTLDGSWEPGGWVLHQIREDKQQPNDMRTAKRVVESIEDDLLLEELEQHILSAREAGKLRQAAACGWTGELPRLDPGPLEEPRRLSWCRPVDQGHEQPVEEDPPPITDPEHLMRGFAGRGGRGGRSRGAGKSGRGGHPPVGKRGRGSMAPSAPPGKRQKGKPKGA